jgi:hypothetical protein
MYRAMARQGGPLAFQTATPQRIGDCSATLDWAVAMGASYVELPHDTDAAGCTDADLAEADAELGGR